MNSTMLVANSFESEWRLMSGQDDHDLNDLLMFWLSWIADYLLHLAPCCMAMMMVAHLLL
jgi:hypothetical protein